MKAGEKFSLSNHIMLILKKAELDNVMEGLKEVYRDGITDEELYPPGKILTYSSIVAEEYAGFFIRLSKAQKKLNVFGGESHVTVNLFFNN
ncbi:MAG TPA: hypothetical protein PK142_02375 [bacterium]|nr:hypothetical protein [bacterium]